jgi:hypothetical protein
MSLKRKTTTATGTKRSTTVTGLGSVSSITVKGARATAAQRRIIDQCLAKAHDLGASRRVMIAVVMTITVESVAGKAMKVTGDDDQGIYQQGTNWVTAAQSRQAAPSTEAFLVSGPTSWKKVHGSVKTAPANLSLAIHAVQGNKDPNAYAAYQAEATDTVDTWLGHDGFGTSGGTSYTKRYEFTRGEKGGARETSWDTMGRLAEEVGTHRWAAGNVLSYASEDELRSGAASLEIAGDEAWLLGAPAWDWASGRAVTEITINVLMDRWSVMPGGVVMMSAPGPTQGRWLVSKVSGSRLDSPEGEVVLKRPTRARPEPAAETGTTSTESGGSASGLLTACKQISSQNRPYVYGGGHGALSAIKAKDGLDCSSSCSLALKRANMFDGANAITSGAFVSWGKAGKGKDFTVWYSDQHVWIEFKSAGTIKRFDTSPHGNGPNGPHTRTTARTDQARFKPRHWS